MSLCSAALLTTRRLHSLRALAQHAPPPRPSCIPYSTQPHPATTPSAAAAGPAKDSEASRLMVQQDVESLRLTERSGAEASRLIKQQSVELSRLTGHEGTDRALHTLTGGRIGVWLQKYESLVGLTEVKEAQEQVLKAEREFRAMQSSRRAQQDALSAVQSKQKALHAALDKVQRGEERYLALLTEEYDLIREERRLAASLALSEQRERDQFSALSSAVRDSHERERARAERTKYWSVIGSIVGAAIGIIGTSLNNYLRMHELKGLVKESTAGGVELKGVVAQLAGTMSAQYTHLHGFVAELRQIVGASGGGAAAPLALATPAVGGGDREGSAEELRKQSEEILRRVTQQDAALRCDMGEIKRLLALQHASRPALGGGGGGEAPTVVYVGPEMEGLLRSTEESLEWKIKSHALVTAALLYGAGALTLYILFRPAAP